MPKPHFEISGFSNEIYVMSGGTRLIFFSNLFQEFHNSLLLLRRDPIFKILWFWCGAVLKFQTFQKFKKSRINHFWFVDPWSEPGQYSGICHFKFGPDLVLTFYSGLSQVLINNSGPSQDLDSGRSQDSGPDLRRSGPRLIF